MNSNRRNNAFSTSAAYGYDQQLMTASAPDGDSAYALAVFKPESCIITYPDDNMTPCVGKTVRIADQIESVGELMIVTLPHSRSAHLGSLIYVRPSTGGTWTFLRRTSINQNIAGNYTLYRPTSGLVSATCSTTSIGSTDLEGQAQSVQFNELPDLRTLDPYTLSALAARETDYSGLVPVQQGVMALNLPAASNEFRRPRTAFTYDGDQNSRFVQVKQPATADPRWLVSAGTTFATDNNLFSLLSADIPRNARGRVKAQFKIPFLQNTAVAGTTRFAFRLRGNTAVPATWAPSPLIVDQTSSVTTYGTTVYNQFVHFEFFLDLGDASVESVEFFVSGANGAGLSIATLSTAAIYTQIEFLDSQFGDNQNGHILVLTGLSPSAQILIRGVSNYQVVPDINLQTEIKTLSPVLGVSGELQMVHNLLSNSPARFVTAASLTQYEHFIGSELGSMVSFDSLRLHTASNLGRFFKKLGRTTAHIASRLPGVGGLIGSVAEEMLTASAPVQWRTSSGDQAAQQQADDIMRALSEPAPAITVPALVAPEQVTNSPIFSAANIFNDCKNPCANNTTWFVQQVTPSNRRANPPPLMNAQAYNLVKEQMVGEVTTLTDNGSRSLRYNVSYGVAVANDLQAVVVVVASEEKMDLAWYKRPQVEGATGSRASRMQVHKAFYKEVRYQDFGGIQFDDKIGADNIAGATYAMSKFGSAFKFVQVFLAYPQAEQGQPKWAYGRPEAPFTGASLSAALGAALVGIAPTFVLTGACTPDGQSLALEQLGPKMKFCRENGLVLGMDVLKATYDVLKNGSAAASISFTAMEAFADDGLKQFFVSSGNVLDLLTTVLTYRGIATQKQIAAAMNPDMSGLAIAARVGVEPGEIPEATLPDYVNKAVWEGVAEYLTTLIVNSAVPSENVRSNRAELAKKTPGLDVDEHRANTIVKAFNRSLNVLKVTSQANAKSKQKEIASYFVAILAPTLESWFRPKTSEKSKKKGPTRSALDRQARIQATIQTRQSKVDALDFGDL